MLKPETYTVMVIEDDPATSRLIERALSSEGYCVLPAANRDESLATLKCTTPDVILLDLVLPDVDGLELLDEMKHLSSLDETPVLIVSALEDVATKVKGLDIGAEDYIVKPVDKDELRARLRVAIRKIEEQKNLRSSLDSAYQDSITDAMTGLYNRRYLDEHLSREFAGAKRDGRIFSLLVIDVDDFKQVNDVYGHIAGDGVLRKIGKIVKDRTRPSDMPARFGGEEFVVYLSNTPIEKALTVAEKLRAEVERCEFEEVTGRGITVSIGVAQSDGSDKTKEDMIERADQALYNAKRSGKNKVVSIS